MAMSSIKVTGAAVVAITAVGKQGTAWLDENDLDAVGQADIRVYHTDGAAPNAATVRLLGKRLYKPTNNFDVMQIGIDSGTDIYYAIGFNTEDEATVILDVK